MAKTLKELKIEKGYETFIIAEAGINHNGSLELAKKMVEAAKKAGASAIKFQTYKTEKRVAADNPVFSILKQCELSFDQQRELKLYADKLGIIFFSTPFDEDCVKFLQELDVPLMKIASFDIVNTNLLRAAAATRIPMIVSRGMADQKEIGEAVKIIESCGTEYALLHCVSAYPAPKDAVNLRVIPALAALYSSPIGFSDHTLDLDACVYAVAAGACILEKHFSLDRNMEGPDQKMSVDPAGLKLLCEKVRELETMLGSPEIKITPAEEGTKIFRRPT